MSQTKEKSPTTAATVSEASPKMQSKDTTSAPDCKEAPIIEAENIFISIEKALTMVCDLANGYLCLNRNRVKDNVFQLICDYKNAQFKVLIANDYLWEAKKALEALANQ